MQGELLPINSVLKKQLGDKFALSDLEFYSYGEIGILVMG